MISIPDTITLACAKLRSRRIMLAVTVAVAGLLFGVLYSIGVLSTGISRSAQAYTHTALGGHYLVKSEPVIPSSVFGFGENSTDGLSEQQVAAANSLQAAYVAQQQATAKQLGLPFDKTSIAPILLPNPYAGQSLPADRRVRYNFQSPVYQAYLLSLQADYAKIAKNTLADLKAASSPYGATSFSQNQSATVNFANLVMMPNGSEDLTRYGPDAKPQSSDLSTYGYLIYSARNSAYSFVDNALIERFILPPNAERRANAAAIPVVLTADEAVALFGKQYGLGAKPSGAGAQLAWMKSLQQHVNGATYTACYRNQAEIDQLTQITQDAAEAAEHKNDPSYTKPTLSYSQPATPCGAITIQKDNRSAAEKTAAQNTVKLQQALGTYQAPSHQKLAFVVVGVMPVSPSDSALTSLPNFMNSLLQAQYGAGAIIPRQLYTALPAASQYQNILLASEDRALGTSPAFAKAGIGETIITFSNPTSARRFINQQGCPPFASTCQEPFTLEAYGSNYILLDDIDKVAARAIQTALPLAAILAAIIIWATMARVIIDSRRETAVFRAIGAKRRDILAVYLLYCLIMAMRIVVFSVALGLGIAFAVQITYGSQVTNYAKVAYGVFDQGRSFNFIGLNLLHLGWLTIGIVSVSLLAISLPLWRNVRRNPIDDMRDE